MSVGDSHALNSLDDRGRWPVGYIVAITGLVAAAVAVSLLAWWLMGSAGEPGEVAVLATQDEVDDTSAEDAPEAEADELEPLPVTTYEVYLDRDPFDPVVPDDTPSPASADDPDAVSPDPDDPVAVTPDPNDADDPDAPGTDPDHPDAPATPAPDDDAPNGSSAEKCDGDAEELVCDGRVLSVTDVTTDEAGAPLAVLQVDTTVYEVSRGERFAEHFRLNGIDGDCVTVLYGDDSFTLCKGEHVLK